MQQTQKHGLPAVMSLFIPGLGQLIKGQIIKAILIWLLGGTIAVLFSWTIMVPVIIWLWNIYDAYNN